MKYVIEFEGFQCENSFVIKELCVISMDAVTNKHFVIKPPLPKSNLNTKEKRTVAFCEKFLHRVFWNSGDSTWKSVRKYIQTFPNSTVVYTKGIYKRDLLSNLFPNLHVLDLEDINCPSITKLIYKPTTQCPLSFHKNILNCAHRKARAFAEFITKHEQSCAT